MQVGLTVRAPSSSTQSYVSIPPITQWKGLNPYDVIGFQTGKIYYFKVDANNVPFQIYVDGENKGWRVYSEFLSDPNPKLPTILEKVFTDSSKAELAFNLAASGMFKTKTQYMIIGDEVPGEGTIDLKGLMDADSYALLKKYMTFMPRQFLRDFFMKKVYPGIPFSTVAAVGAHSDGIMVSDPLYGGFYQYKNYMDMVWSGFVDLFNLANLEYVNQNSLTPEAWEAEKLEAYYVSLNKEALDALISNLDQLGDISLNIDPRAVKIMEQFASLPKLGDTGLEINRQNAIKELLKSGEYETAQAIVDAFRYLNETPLGDILKQEIKGTVTDVFDNPIIQKTN